MNNIDVIIIGNGLIGSMTAKYLRSKGLEVQIIDNSEPMAASKCSFGVFTEGWIGDKIKDKYNDGRDLLEETCNGIADIEVYDVKRDKNIIMQKVDCGLIFEPIDIPAEVVWVKNKDVRISFFGPDCGYEQMTITAKKAVIIAAGAFTDTILNKSKYPMRMIDKYWGTVFDLTLNFKGNYIKEWAPYKQSVLLNTGGNEYIFGDGASVKNPKLDDKRNAMVSERIVTHLTDVINERRDKEIEAEIDVTKIKEGLRPYLAKGETELVKQHDKNLFSATGGAKNTTILCGYVAKQLYSIIKEMDKV